jgi:competence protein ComEC
MVPAVPVLGLIAGAAAGLRWPDIPAALLIAALGGWLLLATHAGRVSQHALLAASIFGGFGVGGAALSAHAWHRAWRPALRLVFESIAHEARLDALRAGRTVPEDDAAPMIVSGVLQSDAGLTTSGAVSLALDVDWAGRPGASNGRTDPASNPVDGGVLLTVLGTMGPDLMREWRAGRRIRASVELRRVARYLDPGVPDQERVLARRGITLVGIAKSAALVEVTRRGSFAAEYAARIRAFTRRALADGVARWSPRASAIVTAIVIGDRTGLEDQVERRLQEAGTYHVIAISGGNIAILAGLTLAAFRVAGMLGRVAMLSAAAGLVAYGFVVGGGASVDRAVLMAVVYFVGRALDLRGPPFHALVLVAGILVIVDPLSVADPASLLTFGATAAIVAVAPLASRRSVPRLLVPVAAMFVASAAAEAALLPVSATIFSRITFAGLVLNFGAIPLMAVAQLAGMAVVPLELISPAAARIVGWLAFVGAEGLVRTAELVTYAPWSTWRVPPPGAVSVAIYYAAGIGAWLAWRPQPIGQGHRGRRPSRPMRWSLLGVAAATGIWIVAGPAGSRPAGDGRLHVTFIDVGQGDAALVRLPRGSSLLIDAGGLTGSATFDVGERVVAPVLRHYGVRRLSTLALTHGDADHVGGAASVLREFRPWDVWDGVPVPPLEPMQRLRSQAMEAGTRWTSVQRNDTAMLDDVQVSVRHPPLPEWERQDVRNDDSVVLELRWRDVSFVFTGDIGREGEAEIAHLFEPALLRVLKVPHHGSTTSSSDQLLRALAPDVAVVSVGRGNNFGHPSPVVLRRYQAEGAAIFRTDQDGAVTVDTDGSSLDVETFTGRRLRLSQPRMSHSPTSQPQRHGGHRGMDR